MSNCCETNVNAIEAKTNTECDNSYVFQFQPIIESIVNKIDRNENIDQILDSDISNVMSALKILIQAKHMNGVNIQYNALLIVKSVLSSQTFAIRKERALMFTSDDEFIKNLLQFEDYMIESDVKHEPIIETYYNVITKLSIHKNFVQKLYAIQKQSIVNCLCVLERWKHRYKIVSAILCYIKRLLKNSLFASILCDPKPELSEIKTNLLIDIIYDILNTHKCMSVSSTHAIEVLAVICRCKEGVSQLLKRASNYMIFLVKLFDDCALNLTDNKSDDKNTLKCLRYLYSILGVFLHLSYISAGREHSIHLFVDKKVLSFMKSIIDNEITSKKPQHLDRVFVLSSLVIQRLLEPLPLPLSSHFNPNTFEIPFIEDLNFTAKSDRNSNGNECNIDENSDYYRSDGSDSDIESDEEKDNQSVDSNSDNCLVSYGQYFPEIKDFVWDLGLKPIIKPSLEPKEETKEGKERKKSIDNIKSLFCSCFANNGSFGCDEEVIDSRNCDNNVNETKMDSNCVKDLIDSAKEDKRKQLFMESADWRQVYTSMAVNTKSIQPIVTLAEPELSENMCHNKLEPLADIECNDMYKTAKLKLLEHIIERFEHKTIEYNVIFDSELENNDFVETKLQFESRFESGNLRKVVQNDMSSNQYLLLLNTDINTCSHVQWFYFRVSNMKANTEYVFNIINCEKQSSLYNEGQRPVMFSTKESQSCDQPFWKRVGYSVAYYRNHYLNDNSISSLMNGKTYYTLSFKIQFPFDSDVCYLAYNYPHSYTYLKSCIHFWQNCHNSCNVYFRHQTLCSSMAGNDVPVLTITSAKPTQSGSGRQYVVLLGRVHPSETNSSWILKGCIDFLLSDRMSAQKLLERYVFKIMPMTNTDGVINGNSRCGGEGDDLNRQWKQPDPLLHPIQYHSKAMIKYLSDISKHSNPVVLVDFHGHSRRKNIFFYGCCPQKSWKRSDRNKAEDESYLALPLILNSMAPAFSLENCCFNVEHNRERTARIAIWRELGLRACYTLECSQAGCDVGSYEGMHLGINQLTEMGFKFCSALLRLEFTYDSVDCRPIPVIPNDLLIAYKDITSIDTISESELNDESIDENE